jgi:hypothetical protein
MINQNRAEIVRMRKYPGIPELLVQFMHESGEHERWMTVHEIRDRFQLTRYQCTTVSGFLWRLQQGTFGQFPYIVTRIDDTRYPAAPAKRICRYLLRRRA